MDNQNNRNKQNLPGNNNPNNKNNRQRWNIILFTVMLISFIVFALYQFREDTDAREITYDQFLNMVDSGEVKKVVIEDDKIVITAKTEAEMKNSKKKGASESDVVEGSVADNNDSSSKDSSDDSTGLFSNVTRKQYYTGIVKDDTLSDRLYKAGVEYEQKIPDSTSYMVMNLLVNIVPLVIMIGLGVMLMRRMTKGGGMMGVGKSNAKMYVEKSTGVTFKDVAGQDEAKESLQEVVDFLHNPGKYTGIGAKLPKGALLVGPPGTGKTLLAKAVAGEAKVPFFSLSGSAFVEMYVGVGASRVRDLFKQAQQMAPCIIFIDEIDAIGKSRDSQLGGNDEREQTLNQLLAEMDGFDSNKGLLLLAATNRPEILDPALLRPGRFDRRIIVDKPDLKGRIDVLKVHAKDVKMDETVNLEEIALATSGAVGSDLANMINEAAINAVKEGREYVCQKDLFEAVEQVLVGKEKKDRIMSAQERKIVSYHEVGHALIAALQKNSEPVQKITIVPRTMGALGYVMHVPEEEKYLNTEAEIHDMLVGYLGGRAAEEIVFDTVTTGASNDIEQATGLARSMVTRFGMSKKFGLIGLESVESQYLDGRTVLNCSDATAAEIDQEVMRILKECYQEALELLSANREVMDQLAAHLIEKETITGKEFMRIYRQAKGLPQEEPEQTAGAQMKAAEQTADTANPSQSDSGNSYGTAPASGTDTEAQPQSSTPKPWEEFARQQQEREDSFFSGDAQQPGDTQQPADPSDAEQSQEQDKPWIPPTPKPENKGSVGRFSGASLPDDEKK